MRYAFQTLLTLGSALIIVLSWCASEYRGAGNLLAMLVPPTVIAIAADRMGRGRRAFMALALTFIHVVALAILGVTLVGY